MSDRILLATFEDHDDLLGAAKTIRRDGHTIIDAFTPYPVHGIDAAIGIRSSRLTWVCFIFGIGGALTMLWFEYWIGAIAWPIDVGGKPWNSLPSNVPVAFELAVLFASFSSVLALFGVCRLFPGKKARLVSNRVTDDHFVLVVDEANAQFDVQQIKTLLAPFHPVAIEERSVSEGGVE